MAWLTGIRTLVLSVVLWAFAVWIFSPPRPVATETVAETTARVAAEKTDKAGMDESVQAGATTASAPPATATHDPASSPGLVHAPSGDSSPRTALASAAEGGTVPATPAAAGDGPHTAGAAIVPTLAGDESAIAAAAVPGASDTPRDGVESVPGVPIVPPVPGAARVPGVPIAPSGPGAARVPGVSIALPVPGAASWQEDAAGAVSVTGDAGGTTDAPPASARPAPRFEPPIPRSLPPAGPSLRRPGGAGAGDGAVADQINAARRAVWEGRLADALVHYRAAARIEPNSHVAWGEMGNVLWAMRRWPEAAYALEGAATLLAAVGELRAAHELLPAVRDIDPEAAQRVQRRLGAASRHRPG